MPAASVEPYRHVTDIERTIGREPIAVDVNDDLADEWAVYFLRDHPMVLLSYRAYMAFPHVMPMMQQSAAPDVQTVRYLLTDRPPAPGAEVIERDGPYELQRLPASGAALLRGVENPNGAERVAGQTFYWLGNGDTVVTVVATSAGEVSLSGRFVFGPSLPDRPDRRLLVRSGANAEQTVTLSHDGDQALHVPVIKGENRIILRALDRPSVPVTGNRDTRPLIVGIQGLAATWQPAAPTTAGADCAVTFATGWQPAEADGLRWSDGTGLLTVASTRSQDLTLRGELLSFVRPNTVTVYVDDRQVARWPVDDPAWAFHAFAPLSLHVRAGVTAVVRLTSEAAPVRQATDPRPLAVALKHVVVELPGGAAQCQVK
jgi:hypothetical protein